MMPTPMASRVSHNACAERNAASTSATVPRTEARLISVLSSNACAAPARAKNTAPSRSICNPGCAAAACACAAAKAPATRSWKASANGSPLTVPLSMTQLVSPSRSDSIPSSGSKREAGSGRAAKKSVSSRNGSARTCRASIRPTKPNTLASARSASSSARPVSNRLRSVSASRPRR